MKICTQCEKENKDEYLFCSSCGGKSFVSPEPVSLSKPPEPGIHNPPPPMPPQSAVPPQPPVRYTQKFGFTEVLTILGFVSSLVGMLRLWAVLEPIAIITSLIGFIKGTRYKGLAAAGLIISIIGFLLKFFSTLWHSGIISEWVVDGIL